jgi:hypothetical protein
MLRAKPCTCEPSLTFERDRCQKCGRWLPHVLAELTSDLSAADPGLVLLDRAIEAQREAWRAEYKILDAYYPAWVRAQV